MTRPRPHLSPEDLRRLLEAAPEAYRGPLVLLADAGLRPAELLRLTWAEVDLPLDALRLARSKTYRTRTIPLTARAREVIERAAARAREGPGGGGPPPPDALVCPLSEKGLRRGFREAVEAAGVPRSLVLYSLRHAYASGLLIEKVSPAVVRDLLGHANIKTTDIYLRSLPGDAARAAVDVLARARGTAGAHGQATFLGKT